MPTSEPTPTRAQVVLRLLPALLLALAAVVTVARPAEAAPEQPSRAAQAATCSIPAGDHLRLVGGRSYRLHVPAGLTSPSKLVLSLHGGAMNSLWMQLWSGWDVFANTHKFVVAYPEGRWQVPPPGVLPNPLNSYWDASETDSPDIAYLLGVVQDVKAVCSVAANHVHIHGVSQGGWMAQRMMCQSAGVFASVSAGAAGHPEVDPWFPPADACTPSRPVSVFLGVGTLDPGYTGVRDNRDVWRARQHCPAGVTVPDTPQSPDGAVIRYGPCDGGTEVIWRELAGIGHDPLETLPEADRAYLLMEQWLFFSANPRP